MDRESLLQEYIQLREELRIYLSRRSRFELVLVATSIIAGLSATIREPIPLLLMASLPIFLIEEQTRRLDAIYRIASYIRVNIEPHFESLNWETHGTKFLKRKGLFSFSAHSLDVIIMSILLIVQFLISAIIWWGNKPDEFIFNKSNAYLLYPIGGVFLLGLLLVIFRFFLIKKRGENYIEKWDKIAADEDLDSIRD